MKLWEILKVENKGKKYKSDAGIIYTLTVDSEGIPLLLNDRNIALPFTQREVFSLDFKEVMPFTGWERVGEGNQYFYIDYASKVQPEQEDEAYLDDTNYLTYNYFSTLEKAQEVRDTQELYRRMKKFCDINQGQVDWSKDKYKYFIYFSHEENIWGIGVHDAHEMPNVVYFNSYDLASKCINEIVRPYFKK